MVIRGDGGGGEGGGKKELLLVFFFTFRGALGLYGSLGCVSNAALTVELADKITISLTEATFFFFFFRGFYFFWDDKALTFLFNTWHISICRSALRLIGSVNFSLS